MEWTDRVEQLLYDGESVSRQLEVGSATVVVTTHRVLVFTPGRSPRYRAVDRPNAGGVTVESSGATGRLLWAVLFAAGGIATGAVAAVFSFADLLPDPEITDDASDAPAPMADITTNTFSTLETTLSLLDTGVVVVAIGLVVLAAVSAVRYLRSRSRALVIDVHGDDDLEIHLDGAVGTEAIELQNAIGPEPTLEDEADRREWSDTNQRSGDPFDAWSDRGDGQATDPFDVGETDHSSPFGDESEPDRAQPFETEHTETEFDDGQSVGDPKFDAERSVDVEDGSLDQTWFETERSADSDTGAHPAWAFADDPVGETSDDDVDDDQMDVPERAEGGFVFEDDPTDVGPAIDLDADLTTEETDSDQSTNGLESDDE